jgi:hypothetical protein
MVMGECISSRLSFNDRGEVGNHPDQGIGDSRYCHAPQPLQSESLGSGR